jgi:hypothetical protein
MNVKMELTVKTINYAPYFELDMYGSGINDQGFIGKMIVCLELPPQIAAQLAAHIERVAPKVVIASPEIVPAVSAAAAQV